MKQAAALPAAGGFLTCSGDGLFCWQYRKLCFGGNCWSMQLMVTTASVQFPVRHYFLVEWLFMLMSPRDVIKIKKIQHYLGRRPSKIIMDSISLMRFCRLAAWVIAF